MNYFFAASLRRLAVVAILFSSLAPAFAQRQMEKLGRGVVVLHSATSAAYVGWRLLATDPTDVGFNLYRSASGAAGVKLNSLPLTNTTDYLDAGANFTVSNAWYVVAVTNGVEATPSAAYGLAANSPVRQYLPLPLQPVTGGAYPPYDVKFCWVGDLDGDGEYDYVVDRLSLTGSVNQYLQAYKRDGTLLWQMDMGYNSTNQYNIEPGASAISVGHGDCVTVYDLDGDGKAEVIVRTARGVVFGDGAVATGPDDTTQYLSIINGLTGHEMARDTITNMWPGDGPMNGHYGIMYCDGVHPSVLIHAENRNASQAFQRETMTYDYRNGQLTRRWFYPTPANANQSWGHQIRIMDVNHDGVDDMLNVGSAFNGVNGQPLFDTELVHGDRFHVTDIDPDRPGLEMYSIQQNNSTLLATALIDVGTGGILKKWYSGTLTDVGRGTALDLNPNYRGCEMYSTQPGIYDSKGTQIYVNSIWPPEALWWDADLSRELEDGAGSGALNPVINKFNTATGNADRLFSIYSDDGAYSTHQAYGGRAAFWGDILGDWREELVLVQSDYAALRIYTTKIAATNRLYCLMQNPAYRDQATCKGYYQASYVDYYLGNDMPAVPVPPLSSAKLVWRGGAGNVWDAATTANWFTNWYVVGNANTNPAPFNAGDTVLFDISGSNNTAVTLTGSLTPGDVRVWSPNDYIFSGDGALAGAMKLTKAGAGKLIFNGTNTYTGATLVGEGPFLVNGALPNSPLTVRGGVWMDGRLGGTGVVGAAVKFEEGAGFSPGALGTNSPGTITVANTVTLAGRTRSNFDLSDDPTGVTKTNDLAQINGNLVLTGTNTFIFRLLDGALPPGAVYPLVNYTGTLIGSLNSLLAQGLDGYPYAFTNPPGQIALIIKTPRTPATLTWTGGQNGNSWDLASSTNWLNGAAKDQFYPQDTVRFDSVGASNLTVNLAGALIISNLVVDSPTNYTLTGAGQLMGVGGLLKSNTGTLTVSGINHTFTGRTVIAGGGTLAVAELDGVGFPSSLGSAPNSSPTNLVITGSSTLRILGECYTDRGITISGGTNTIDVVNGTDQFTLLGVLTGTSAFQKLGPGNLAFTAANTYSGTTIIKGGSVSLGGDAANTGGFGPGTPTVILDGATVTMFIDNNTTQTSSWNLVAATNSVNYLNLDWRCVLAGSGSGSGTLTMWTPYIRADITGNWSTFSGQLYVTTDLNASTASDRGGDFRIANAAGFPNAKINLQQLVSMQNRVSTGTTISIGELSGDLGCNISASGGSGGLTGTWSVGGLNTSATFGGNTYNAINLTKVGTGTWTWTGTNISHSGTTTVSAGALFVNGNAAPASGAVSVGASGTLGGTGVLGGATTVSGKISPGVNAIGTLTFSNNVTLANSGTAFIEINRTAGTKDLVNASGTVTYGGTLSVTNLAGTLANGDSFKIFNGAAYAGIFATKILPALNAGLIWDTSALTTSGAIAVVISNGVPTGPKTLVWKGDGSVNTWDINGTANWLDAGNAAAYFTNGDFVNFTDVGSNNVPVVLQAAVAPGSFSINAAKDFVLSGSGSINGTNGLVKSGGGTFTLMTTNGYTGATTISDGTLRLLGLGAGLAHRWSFNNSLADSAGNSPASIVDVGANNVTQSATSVTLAGGTRTTSDYISLGQNLFPNTTAPVTLEIWATQNAAQTWARIFDFGASTTENFLMAWSQGTTLTTDRVEWKDSSTSTADNTCQPYTLGTEFHIALVIEPGAGAGGTTRVTWYRAASTNSTFGAARGTTNSANTLAAFVNTNCWLGRSEYTGDNTASASYNEVRLWSRALSAAELQTLHTNGPDAGLNSALPPNTAVNLSGATGILDLQNGGTQTVGSLAGAAGSEVRLTSASLIAGGNNSSTTFAGFISGTNSFTKTGGGTLELSGANTHTGGTTLSNGTLLVNGSLAGNVNVKGGKLGGNGGIGGATTIASGATLAPGNSIGTLTFSNALTLAAGSTNIFEINRDTLEADAAIISGALTNGGTLIVTNLGATPPASGSSFTLFTAASFNGTFAKITLPPLPFGLGWVTNGLITNGTLSVVTWTRPVIGAISISETNLTFSGSSGVGSAPFYLLGSTNLTAPVANWTVLLTNQFDAGGNFSFTNALDQNWPQGFYRLQLP